MTTARTKFANLHNPFTGESTRKPPKSIDPGRLCVADDPLPRRKRSPVHKYDALFGGMSPGQCVVCPPDDVSKIAHAAATWIKRKGKSEVLRVRSIKRYEDTDTGRVWLLARE